MKHWNALLALALFPLLSAFCLPDDDDGCEHQDECLAAAPAAPGDGWELDDDIDPNPEFWCYKELKSSKKYDHKNGAYSSIDAQIGQMRAQSSARSNPWERSSANAGSAYYFAAYAWVGECDTGKLKVHAKTSFKEGLSMLDVGGSNNSIAEDHQATSSDIKTTVTRDVNVTVNIDRSLKGEGTISFFATKGGIPIPIPIPGIVEGLEGDVTLPAMVDQDVKEACLNIYTVQIQNEADIWNQADAHLIFLSGNVRVFSKLKYDPIKVTTWALGGCGSSGCDDPGSDGAND